MGSCYLTNSVLESVSYELDKFRSFLIRDNNRSRYHLIFLCFSLQFICGLSLCCGTQAHLSREEIQKVVDVYRQPDGRVRYKEFCHIMENGQFLN